IDTANGMVEADRATIADLRVGSLAMRGHDVLISDGLGETNLLGMNFLSELESWRVEGSSMILVPRQHSH
ncbi:retroviral-like aspartic protease family protein, partial [Erythrobacter donghaensis]